MMVNMPIARKMTVVFGAIIGLTVLTSAFILYQTERVSAEIDATKRAGAVLQAMQDYEAELKEAYKSVLHLVTSSEIRHVSAVRDNLAALDDGRAELSAIVPPDSATADILGRIDELVARWRGEVVSRQLDDMNDPYTVDLARLREASVTNRGIWDEIDSLFAEAMASQYARMESARDTQGGELAILRIASAGSAVVLLMMGVAMAGVMNRSVAAPLRRLAEVTERLRDRQWDVAVTGTERGDELGRMSRALEVFRDTGRRNEQVEAEQREEAERRLAAAESLKRAVSAFRDGAECLLGKVDGTGASLDDAAATLNEVAGSSHSYTRSVSQAADATGESVQNVAAAIEEMSLSIRDISGQLQGVSRLTQRAADTSGEAGEKVTGLQTRSERINEVVDLINDIAGQINLLALNATIEAARAGEAGKGFAVVAQHVKQLADQTERATEDIGRVVGEVRADVAEVVRAIRSIEESIAEVNSSSSAVAAAVEEQSTALDEISRNVTDVSNQTSEVAGNVRGVETKVEETCAVAGTVHELSGTLKDSSKQLGATIEDFIGTVANDAAAPSRAG